MGVGVFTVPPLEPHEKEGIERSQSQFNGSGGFHALHVERNDLRNPCRNPSSMGVGVFTSEIGEVRVTWEPDFSSVAIPVQWEWGFSLAVKFQAPPGTQPRRRNPSSMGVGVFTEEELYEKFKEMSRNPSSMGVGVFTNTTVSLLGVSTIVAIPVQWEWETHTPPIC